MLYSKNTVAIPPGETIREQLEDRGMSQREFSLRMGISEKHISRLINGKVELTSDMALRLETVLGLPAAYWNNLESIYRDKLARVKAELEMEHDCEIARNFPYSKMANLEWVPATRKIEEKVKNLRAFFEVAHLEVLEGLRVPGIAFRKMGENEQSDYALAAWAQKARLEARKANPAPINIKKLIGIVPKIRDLTVKTAETFCVELREMLLSCGIVIVFLPHIGGSFLHGASFVDGNHIVLGLTVRGKDADRFWFSLFHELCHIIEGHIYNPDGTTDEEEALADRFARDTLISPDAYDYFLGICGYDEKESILRFAKSINIAPGIVLGRMQKEHRIPYNRYSELKIKYEIV